MRLTRKTIVVSVIVSLAVLLLNYIVGNTSIPLPNEMSILQGWDKFVSVNGTIKDSIPDEIMLIDVAYDKELVDYEEDGFYVGKDFITDRNKLFQFLSLVKEAGNYKYVMLDVIFEEGYKTPYDSALFHLIAQMDRIVIATHEDTNLQDSILLSKAANADYTTTWKETNFSRFQYLHEDQASIPLQMYRELEKKDIRKFGFLYFSNNWLCRNAITLKMPYRITSDLSDEGERKKFNVVRMGSDLLDSTSVTTLADEIEGRILVIGDFKHDIHETYAGIQPGSLINLNAYYALKRGDHSLFGQYGGTLCFYLLIACLYFCMSILYLSNFKIEKFVHKKWLRLALSPVSIGMVFVMIALIAYKPFGIVYNIWLPVLVFSSIDFISNLIFTQKERS